MSGYNSKERRGLLILLGIMIAFALGASAIRSCNANRADDGVLTEQRVSGDGAHSADADKSDKTSEKTSKGKKSRNKSGKKRTKKTASNDFPYRDILSDTIPTMPD